MKFNKCKINDLLYQSFGKTLKPEYFKEFQPIFIKIIKDNDDYIGIVIVEEIPETNIFYLDKLAVHPNYRSNGVGNKLWDSLQQYSHKCVWRAKKENRSNIFYAEKADGKLKFPDITDYFIYYYGLNSFDLDIAIRYTINKESSFEA